MKWSSPLASLEVLPPFSQDKASVGSEEDSYGGDALQTESALADISMYRPLSAVTHSGSVVVGFTCYSSFPAQPK